MERERELSPLAQARMAEMLPSLVGAVRWRRRRRHAVRVGAAAALLALLVATWPDGAAAPGPVGPSGPSGPSGHASQPLVLEVVRDDPSVLDRYRVADTVRQEWFVGDDELQQFLREGARPAGIVRVGARVMVVSSAIDPLPKGQAE